MKALVLIQDELILRNQIAKTGAESKIEDRNIVLCIAYHNIAVEQEFQKMF